MAITRTGISYYGIGYVAQAERDFAEMKAHGCTTVILAVTEFDADFWFPSIAKIVEKAHEAGLYVLLDPWGIGKYFGGEQVSLYLQNNVENRQVSALTGEKLNAACFNTQSFRDYFKRFCLRLADSAGADGFFWDEPHYALPKAYASITGGSGDDWACRCPMCQKKFLETYGYEMPRLLTDDVKRFRWNEAMRILEDTSREIKRLHPEQEITVCVHATQQSYYVTELRGYDNWEEVAACPYFDVFATTIISWDLPRAFFRQVTERTVAAAHKYGKPAERWVMNYYKRPESLSEMDEVINLYEELGVDRVSAWTYRGGEGTVLAAPDALQMWGRLGENYRRLLKKQTEGKRK